jgi:hypothetical protein
MARPKGKKSLYKKRNTLKHDKAQEIVENYGRLSNKEICEKYQISKSQLRSIRLDYKVKNKNISKLLKHKISLDETRVICGLYVICRNDLYKAYIGSSEDVIQRLKLHFKELNKNNHYNKGLQTDFNIGSDFLFYIIEECSPEKLLKKEHEIIISLHEDVIYNKNKQDSDFPLKELYLNKVDKNLIKVDNGCWEWQKATKEGYGYFIYDKKQYLCHRVSYAYHYNDYPYLVHHKCHNRKCCNPEHLESSTSKHNAINKYKKAKSNLEPYKDLIISMVEEGKTFREIADHIAIVGHTAVFRYYKDHCVAKGGFLSI